MNVAIFGLGKIGSTMAIVFAKHGHDVCGVDVESNVVEAMSRGRSPFPHEPFHRELTGKYRERMFLTTDFREALKQKAEIIFIIVPTLSLKSGSYSLGYINRVAKQLKGTESLVVVNSTVMPGHGEEIQRKIGVKGGYCYNPLFVAMGNLIEHMEKPDLVLIGESDSESGEQLENFWRTIVEEEVFINRMNVVSAELFKLFYNIIATTKISLVNILTEMCQKTPGVDIQKILEGLRQSKRTFSPTLFFRPGLGYGGPCFPRDNKAFTYHAKKVGSSSAISRAVDKVNEHQIIRTLKEIQGRIKPGMSVGFLGITYKAKVPYSFESQSLKIIQELLASNIKIHVIIHDSMAMSEVRRLFKDKVEYAESSEELIQKSDMIVFGVEHDRFDVPEGKFVIDPFSVFYGLK